MARSTFVYVTYIRSTPEKLWSAMTDDVEFMKQYWFGTHCEDHLQPQVPAENRLRRAAGPVPDGQSAIDALRPITGRQLVLTCERHQPAERVKLGLCAHAFDR
jgi:uncharacterized protein YndB with AHSA1/START domain